MFRSGAATSAYQVQPTLLEKAAYGPGHHLRAFVVTAILVGKSCIGDTGHGEAGKLRQCPEVVGHEFGAGGAVETDPKQVTMSHGGIEGFGVLPGQQGPHGFHGTLNRYRHSLPGFHSGPVDALQPGLNVDRVLGGLQQQYVGAALNKPYCLLLICCGQVVEVNAAGYRYAFGGRSH